MIAPCKESPDIYLLKFPSKPMAPNLLLAMLHQSIFEVSTPPPPHLICRLCYASYLKSKLYLQDGSAI